jgi:hypothetical protein
MEELQLSRQIDTYDKDERKQRREMDKQKKQEKRNREKRQNTDYRRRKQADKEYSKEFY